MFVFTIQTEFTTGLSIGQCFKVEGNFLLKMKKNFLFYDNVLRQMLLPKFAQKMDSDFSHQQKITKISKNKTHYVQAAEQKNRS